jgi:hypothetical protein
MKKNARRILLMLLFTMIIGVSCSKSEKYAGSPSIELIGGDNLITKDTSALMAETLHFRVHCKWNGEQTLTNFIVASNNIRVVDEGMNTPEFEKNVDFAKSNDSLELIVFTIRDIKGGSSSTSLKVAKNSGAGGGELVRYNNITLNGQNASNGKSFFSFTNGIPYTLQDAFGIQQEIQLLYYYDNITSDANTLASPGANVDNSIFTGQYGLSNWSTKNTSRFYQISLTQQEFDAITDPVKVVNSYSESLGKRKAKNLAVGDVYSFKVESMGKYGILRVSEVSGQDAGKVTFSIVMQK